MPLTGVFDKMVSVYQIDLAELHTKVSHSILREYNIAATSYEVEQSLKFLQVFGDALKLFFPRVFKEFRSINLETYLRRMICNNEIKTTKLIKYYYCSLCPFTYQSRDKLKKPDGALKGSKKLLPVAGRLYKHLMQRLRICNKKTVTFCSTIYLSRYGSLTVPSSFIEEADRDYIKRLTRPATEKTYDMDSIKLAIRQFGKVKAYDVLDSLTNFLSVSAVSEQHIHGQYGVIDEVSPKIRVETSTFTYHGICPVPYFFCSFLPKNLSGKVTHLPEPLKVRSITAGSAYEFIAGKPFQKIISDNMKKMENLCFGREVSELDISNLITRSRDYYGEEEELLFLSADYASATDNLNPNLSKIVDNAMIDSMGLNFSLPSEELAKPLWNIMAKILQYCLDEHIGPNSIKKYWSSINLIFHEKLGKQISSTTVLEKRQCTWSGRSIEGLKTVNIPIIQTFGQMMGDIKSFPVLCAINLSLWNHVNDNKIVTILRSSSCPLTGIRTFRKDKIFPPCLVNGDDFLAFAPMRIIEKWFSQVGEFDLETSIGKTFVSPVVAQINSTNFLFKGKEVKKINPIPLHAVHNLPRDGPIHSVYNYAIEQNPKVLFPMVLSYNKNLIRKVSWDGLVNLCLPVELGGLGVNFPPKNITYAQELIARNNKHAFEQGYLNFSRVKPIMPFYDWIPFNTRHQKNKKEFFFYDQKPRGTGLTKDKFGFEHVLPTYKNKCQELFRDDWVSNLSRLRFSGRNGIMKIRKDFFKLFISTGKRLIQQVTDKRRFTPSLPNRENQFLYKGVLREKSAPFSRCFAFSGVTQNKDNLHISYEVDIL